MATIDNHYSVLALARDCTSEQIRAAYRLLAKRHHPDLNPGSTEARALTERLNAAYEILGDPERRRAYDRELDRASQAAAPGRRARIDRNIKQEVRLRIDDFLRGTSVDVQVNDPANPDGRETYRVNIPAMTAPGARLWVPRTGSFATGSFLELQLKALPGFRYKLRGSDLRTDLQISAQRAEAGGTEMVPRPTGGTIRVPIPKRMPRGTVIRLPGEGMPKARGARGDLLVRVTYRPQVRVSRTR